jgi:hypothetical protein
MAETFKLPVSSYEELLKLFQAYANAKEGVALSLDQISQATGVSRTIVSKNNGFMVQIGLITEGTKKAATEIGRSLGRAYSSKLDYEIERIWKEIIADVDFLNRMVSAVRIRNGMDRTNFINHIIYSSGLKDSKDSRAGAGAIIEILKNVGILDETDGKLTVCDEIAEASPKEASTSQSVVTAPETSSGDSSSKLKTIKTRGGITINININCTAEDLDTLGEKVKNLLDQISE